MPYSNLKTVPDSLKKIDGLKLSLSQINSIAKQADAMIKSGTDKSIAWATAKKHFKDTHKKKGETWVKENEEKLGFSVDLKEASFDDASKTATVTIIKEGWSLNSTGGRRRYYSKSAISDIVELLPTAKKMYGDHSSKSRSVFDWAATVNEAWLGGNGVSEAKAKIDFTANPATSWLYEEAKKHPEEVGISVDAVGMISVGEVEGKEAAIIESVKRLSSSDFVTTPAAGGRVDLAESYIQALNETLKSIGDRIKDYQSTDMPYLEFNWAFDALSSFLYELSWDSAEDINKNVNKALKDFAEKIKVAIEGKRSLYTNTENLAEGVTKTEGGTAYPASAYLLVPDKEKPSTWKLRYKNYDGDSLKIDKSQLGAAVAAVFKGYRGNKVKLSSTERKSVIAKIKKAYKSLGVKKEDWPESLTKENWNMKLEDFRVENPDTYEEIIEQANLIAKNEAEKEVKDDLKVTQEELEKIKKEFETVKEELKNAKVELDKYHDQEKLAEKEKFIAEQLKESEIKEISDDFRSILMESEEEVIKKLIQDKKESIKAYEGKIKGLGKEEVKEEVKEEKIVNPWT